MKGLLWVSMLLLGGFLLLPWLWQKVPPQWDPFAPLTVTDPPGWVTRYKLKQLASDNAACQDVLARAQQAGYVTYSRITSQQGSCPLVDAVRVSRFGDVRLSSSFMSSCALAVSSTMMVQQALKPLAVSQLGSPLQRIDHLGSYACRNIYHRPEGRLSEHASADAWDVSAFQLKNGQQISIVQHWDDPDTRGRWLRTVFSESCNYFGNSLGPDYNAAHANHFHLGMRGFGLCR